MIVLVEPWSDQKLATRLAEEAGAKASWSWPRSGGAGPDNYIDSHGLQHHHAGQALR